MRNGTSLVSQELAVYSVYTNAEYENVKQFALVTQKTQDINQVKKIQTSTHPPPPPLNRETMK